MSFSLVKVQASELVVDCSESESLSTSSEALALLLHVKNEVLGSVPKFCRTGEHDQLADADGKEDALSSFVEKLKKISSKKGKVNNNPYPFDKKSVVFETLKVSILKKAWEQASNESRYNILLASECRELELNKFPIHQNKKMPSLAKEKQKVSYQKTLVICGADEFSEIAPYVSKEILAESLLYLSEIFPNEFDSYVDMICTKLKETDETLLGPDAYESFLPPERSLSSVQLFSNWLKELYSNFEKNFSNMSKNQEKQDALNKKIEESGAQADSLYKSNDAYDGFVQVVEPEELERMYLAGQKTGSPEAPVPYGNPKNEEVIVKDADGKYQVTFTKEKFKKLHAQQAILNEKAKKTYKKNVETKIAKTQAEMKEAYEVYMKQFPEKSDMPAPSPIYPNYFIVKGKDGNYYYQYDEKLKKELLAKIKEVHKVESALVDYSNPDSQAQLQSAYEAQQLKKAKIQKGEVDYTPSQFEVYEQTIIKEGEGYEFKTIPTKSGNEIHALYKKLAMPKSDIPVPVFGDFEPQLHYQSSDGNFYSVALTAVFPEAKEKVAAAQLAKYQKSIDESAVAADAKKTIKQSRPVLLKSYITEKFQGLRADNDQFENLSAEEVRAIRSYTDNGFVDMNNCLRTDGCSLDKRQKIDYTISALKKLKRDSEDEEQIFYRGVSFLPEQIKSAMDANPKNFAPDKGFMSTTGSLNTALGFAGVDSTYVVPTGSQALFIMKAKSCVGVSAISVHKDEDEFICPPGLKFNIKRKSKDANIYIMEEVK